MKLVHVTACICFVYSGFLFKPEAKKSQKIALLCLLQKVDQTPGFQGSQKTSGYGNSNISSSI